MNIPLFYLYGGIDGKGCRIQFTDARIREIIKNCSISYVNNQYKRLKKVIQPSEYDIYYDWIYYISSNGYCEHKKVEKYYQSLDDAKRILSADNRHYFIKNPIWKYENEFRIVVVFKEEIPYKHIALNFNIKDNEKGISVAFGPETSEEECKAFANEFSDYGITKCNRISESAVSMGLVKRNSRLLDNSTFTMKYMRMRGADDDDPDGRDKTAD